MNRVVVSTVAVLVALVGFAMMGEDQEAAAGLFGRKCCKPACCEPSRAASRTLRLRQEAQVRWRPVRPDEGPQVPEGRLLRAELL